MALGRTCDGCTMCCKLLKVGDKPAMQWCDHCAIGAGCKIYEERPGECRTFHCGYLRMAELTEAWRPSDSKMVVAIGPGDKRLTVFVDPSRRGQWRNEPYYKTLKGWARALCPRAGQILVHDGPEVFAILPDRDKNLGPHREGRRLTSVVDHTPAGPICDVIEEEAPALTR
jgi:hypothetical protein